METLEAAMFAPSAGNEQPWQFIVVDERKILDDVLRICSAAVQNILLAAHAVGLGAVWADVYPLKDRVEGFRRLFSLPEGKTPFAQVPLGHSGQSPDPQEGAGKSGCTTMDGSAMKHHRLLDPDYLIPIIRNNAI